MYDQNDRIHREYRHFRCIRDIENSEKTAPKYRFNNYIFPVGTYTDIKYYSEISKG